MTARIRLQIVGFGPAAVGIFVAADRLGVVNALLNHGVYIYEKHENANQWNSLDYKIPSNSPVGDFISGIRKDGIFADVMNSVAVRRWLDRPDESICLTLVSRFLKELMKCVVNAFERNRHSKILWGSAISKLYLDEEKGFCVPYDRDSHVLSDSLVLASGAKNREMPKVIPKTLAVVSSDSLLRRREQDRIKAAIGSGHPIVIFGGSHSGFSSVGYLLREFGPMLSRDQIHVVSRSRVVQMYSARECADRVLDARDFVNPLTGEINKFNGLRRDARALYRSIVSGDEWRVRLYELEGNGNPITDCLELKRNCTPLIINATGYEPRVPQLFDSNNNEVRLTRTTSNVCKDPCSGELLSEGRAIRNLFATGLGFADSGVDGNQVGINFFHNQTAQRVVENLIRLD